LFHSDISEIRIVVIDDREVSMKNMLPQVKCTLLSATVSNTIPGLKTKKNRVYSLKRANKKTTNKREQTAMTSELANKLLGKDACGASADVRGRGAVALRHAGAFAGLLLGGPP
jgi:hypothetical protein